MAPTLFQVVDRLMDKAKLSAKDLFGSKKAADSPEATALLEQATTDGLVARDTGKTPKYSLTDKGRDAWVREAPAEKRAAFEEQGRQQERRELMELLGAVEKSQGKALKGKYSEALLAKASEQSLIENVKGKVYRLLPPGEALVAAAQPLEKQVETLRRLHGEALRQWAAAGERLQGEIAGLARDNDGLRAAAETLAAEAGQAAASLEAAIAQLGAYSVLLAAARSVKERMEAAYAEARQQLDAARGNVEGLQGRLAEEGQRVSQRVEATQRRIVERLEELEKRPAAGPAPTAPGEPEPAAPPSEDAARGEAGGA
jgi:chromosome segregation ATPase